MLLPSKLHADCLQLRSLVPENPRQPHNYLNLFHSVKLSVLAFACSAVLCLPFAVLAFACLLNLSTSLPFVVLAFACSTAFCLRVYASLSSISGSSSTAASSSPSSASPFAASVSSPSPAACFSSLSSVGSSLIASEPGSGAMPARRADSRASWNVF